jgi:hypothetical protein
VAPGERVGGGLGSRDEDLDATDLHGRYHRVGTTLGRLRRRRVGRRRFGGLR